MNVMNTDYEISAPNDCDPRLWYVVQTKPADERRVETNLLNQEIEIFLPLNETYQFTQGKMARRIKPLFPSYLFAKLDLQFHFYKVKYTRGVNKILGNGNGPTPISGKVIEGIKVRTGKDNVARLEEEWKEGDPVKVTSGPFKELTGIFQKRMSDQGRVRILLSLIGVDVPVQLSQWQIRKVA